MSDDLQAHFDAAIARSKTLPKQPPKVQLELYGLFKQASDGDVSGKRPGPFDVRGRAKYDAWRERSGMDGDEAKRAYIAVVDRIAGGGS